MQATTLRFRSATLLLAAVFSVVHLRLAYPPPPKPVVVRHWASVRPLVPDSVLHDFVRQLLAQSDTEPPRPFSKHKADFWISRVLLDHTPVGLDVSYMPATDLRYYDRVSAPILRQLYTEHIISATDTAFMRQQTARNSDFKLYPASLPGCKIIPVELLKRRMKQHAISDAGFVIEMQRLKREYQTQYISFLSAPLFSRDGRWAVTTVILNTNTSCGVGNTLVLVMEKKKGQWRQFRAVNY